MTRPRLNAGLLAAVLLAGCGTHTIKPSAQRFVRAGGVAVTIAVRAWDGHRGILAVTLTPKPGFHLYSINFPARGVDGVGQRTDVNLVGAIRRTGPLEVALPVDQLRIPGVHGLLAVYPPEPVQVIVHIHKAAGSSATVVASYAACSAATCLPPVLHRQIRFHL